MNGRRLAIAALVALAFAVRLIFLLGDPHPHQLAGLSAIQGEIARTFVDDGQWFKINTNAMQPGVRTDGKVRPANGGKPVVSRADSVLERQEVEKMLLDPADLDYSPADAKPRYEPYVVHMQGTAVLLAGLWEVTGDKSYIYLQVIQVIAGSLIVLLVWWIAMVLFSRPRTAYLAALIYALALPLAALMRLPFYDSWATILVPVVVAAFIRAWRSEAGREQTRWLVATGLITGIALWFRPPIVFVPVTMGLVVAFERGWRPGLRFVAVPLALAALLLAPWTVRNAIEFNKLIPANIGTGQVLWQGLGEKANDFGAYNDDVRTLEQVRAVRPDLRYDTPAYDSYLLRKAIRAIKSHPGYYVTLIGDRLLRGTIKSHPLSWSAHAPHWATVRPRSLRDWGQYAWDKFQVAVALFGDPGLLLIALGTVALTWRRFRFEHLLMLAVPAGLLIVPVFLATEFRYVAPGVFAWIILASLGIDMAAERLLARRSAQHGEHAAPVRAQERAQAG